MGHSSQTRKAIYKDEILAMYLNKFEFINGAHGIEAASQTYFNKLQKDLNVSEAATLIGMLKILVSTTQLGFQKKC